ncbi:enoyl-CoA hydratase/isomerase family protein [uncultured Rhodoblastus sp.]|uniref:enoyl-CoA hydratase/isomerase family protein n=1 Tax=uncultured Rhodoblastus sp. TaxID=543037 RepID=UPI0025D0C496|nr:enoyl-CoA hydratase/isomerase family protein [uncultured Rhodoblastus sp.]
MNAEAEVLVDVAEGVGFITLNRPKAINALTHGMVRTIASALAAWSADVSVHLVLIRGAGERGFCAGGDIRDIYEAMLAGDPRPAAFWRDEYALNQAIADYSKPVVVVMNGIVMGGGIGLSAHGSHRIVTQTTTIAMPETSIGFLPDVGGSYLLSQAPGEGGTQLALTAGRIGAADALFLGLADVHIENARLADLPRLLSDCRTTEDVASRLRALATPPAPGQLADDRQRIDAAYASDSVEEICARLEAGGEPQSLEDLQKIRGNSPTSLKITLRALRKGRQYGKLAPCLAMELTAATHIMRGHDMREGIRAAVIDKDRKPKWSPARLEDVSEATVDAYFVDSD